MKSSGTMFFEYSAEQQIAPAYSFYISRKVPDHDDTPRYQSIPMILDYMATRIWVENASGTIVVVKDRSGEPRSAGIPEMVQLVAKLSAMSYESTLATYVHNKLHGYHRNRIHEQRELYMKSEEYAEWNSKQKPMH